VALNITLGKSKGKYHSFKMGEFVFEDEGLDNELQICWASIDYIKKMNGHSPYTTSSRFWKAMLKMVRHPAFKLERWETNFKKMIDHFTAKASTNDYLSMMQKVYNWRNSSTINLLDDEIE
jgi:hypothetical protein